MKNKKIALNSVQMLWTDVAVGVALTIAFALLGYFAREFALDLQTAFFLM